MSDTLKYCSAEFIAKEKKECQDRITVLEKELAELRKKIAHEEVINIVSEFCLLSNEEYIHSLDEVSVSLIDIHTGKMYDFISEQSDEVEEGYYLISELNDPTSKEWAEKESLVGWNMSEITLPQKGDEPIQTWWGVLSYLGRGEIKNNVFYQK